LSDIGSSGLIHPVYGITDIGEAWNPFDFRFTIIFELDISLAASFNTSGWVNASISMMSFLMA